MNIKEKLINRSRDVYGNSFQEHVLEIYKLYVEKADSISTRRQYANTFFLTVNTGIIGLVSYFENQGADWPVILAGVILCCVWYALIRSYKNLNSAKFKVIHEIEKELPIAPYDAEWEAVGRGKDRKKYFQITRIEVWVPCVFGILYLILLSRSIYW